MDRPMGDTAAIAAKDVEVDDQTRRLGASGEGTGCKGVPECVPAGCGDLSGHSAAGERVERSGARIFREGAASERIGARVDVELGQIGWRLGSRVKYPIPPKITQVVVDRRVPVETIVGVA